MQLQPWPASTSARGEQEWDLPQQPSEPQSVSPSNSTLRLHPPLALLLFLSTAGHRPRACAPRRRHMRVCACVWSARVYAHCLLQWTDSIQEADPLGNIDAVDYLVMLNTASMMLRGLAEVRSCSCV